ncbi:phytoene desaturase family protein [Streptomyces sp. NPDC058751]|uniref:phytoene desaturase family protein n=1 Tax=Streptomyces sp. NPDC058751 TaxID=3346623 RepID=UPI00367EEF58
MADAVVIGAGPNGLVAANLLADAGWSVEVLEAQDTPGGAVRHDHGVDPDFTSDVFSAFYPLAAASRVLGDLRLEQEGLAWSHAPKVLAHPLRDGRCAVLSRDLEETAASLETFAPGDGPAWKELWRVWETVREGVLDALFTPFPPVRAGAALALRLRTAGGLRLARTLVLPVRRMGEEEFRGEGGRLLLAGNALHADLAPEAAGSGGFGWLMSMLGQTYGFPVPAGGSGALSSALARRLARHGGAVRCGQRVTEVVVRGGRAVGVRTASGEGVPARRAVLADVSAPALYGSLVAGEHLPPRLLADLKRFQWDFATFKVDWALDGRVPWSCPEAAQAGTVHLAEGVDALTRFASQIAMGRVPDEPFSLFGQMTTADPGRSPRGTEAAWAYTHVPQQVRGDAGEDGLTGSWDAREQEVFADRMEAHVERYAPGFRGLVRARRILAPPTLESLDANLHRGAINGGTTALHQQLVFRPGPGTGRPETPVPGLYLASASAHPGGCVHGAPGANAARAALRRHRTAALSRLQSGLTHRDRRGRR